MITIIVLVAVAIIVFILASDGLYDIGEGIFYALAATFVTFMFSMLIGFGIALSSDNRETIETGTTSLSAIASGSETEGAFFLGSGTVDEERVINYVSVTEDGGKTLESIPVEDAIIYEDATVETARLETTIDRWQAWWWAPWHLDVNETTAFHVPAGTVSGDFDIQN